MTAAAEQPMLDLGDYRGKKITSVKTKLANSNDGFDPTTGGIEGRIYEIGEVLTIAVRVVVTSHTPKLVDIDKGELELLQTFKAGTMSVVADKLVAKDLDAVEKAQKAAEAAKPKKPVRRGQLRSVATGSGPVHIGETLSEALAK